MEVYSILGSTAGEGGREGLEGIEEVEGAEGDGEITGWANGEAAISINSWGLLVTNLCSSGLAMTLIAT